VLGAREWLGWGGLVESRGCAGGVSCGGEAAAMGPVRGYSRTVGDMWPSVVEVVWGGDITENVHSVASGSY